MKEKMLDFFVFEKSNVTGAITFGTEIWFVLLPFMYCYLKGKTDISLGIRASWIWLLVVSENVIVEKGKEIAERNNIIKVLLSSTSVLSLLAVMAFNIIIIIVTDFEKIKHPGQSFLVTAIIGCVLLICIWPFLIRIARKFERNLTK